MACFCREGSRQEVLQHLFACILGSTFSDVSLRLLENILQITEKTPLQICLQGVFSGLYRPAMSGEYEIRTVTSCMPCKRSSQPELIPHLWVQR